MNQKERLNKALKILLLNERMRQRLNNNPRISLFVNKKLVQLNLSSLDIKALPENFFDPFPELQFIDLSSNQIISLPGSITDLTQLRRLYLRDNPLTKNYAQNFKGRGKIAFFLKLLREGKRDWKWNFK